MIDVAEQVAALNPSDKVGALRASQGTTALKGHGFSRAARATGTDAALAAEGMQMIEKIFPRGLKPRPFKAVDLAFPLRHSAAGLSRTFLLCVAAALLAAPQARADAAPAPAAQPANHWHEASLEDYRSHLQALTTIVEACAKTRDTKTCDPALVGPDDHVSLSQSANVSADSKRRLVRYGWLRVLLAKAQDKDKAAGKPEAKPATKPATSPRDTPTEEPTRPPERTTTELLQDAETRLAQDLAQTDATTVAAPVHAQERETMKQVLAGREFRNLEEPTARDSALEKLGNWLNRIFESAAKLSSHSVWIGRVIVWGFILAVCVGLVWGLIQLERRWRIRLVPEGSGTVTGAASARDWQLWLEDARKAAASGLWREAIHFVYWASISRLESRRLWPADRARTPREYLALVAPEDPRKAGLATLTGSFERIWYGGRAAGESDYRNAEQLATALISGTGATVAGGGPAQ